MKNTRTILLWVVALFVLGFVNYLTYQREELILNGRMVLLELAPVDPRSLIQGDYMRLNYAISNEIADRTELERGFVVIRLDENNVAHFARIYNGISPLADNELLLPFRAQFFNANVGPESFFFQEGHAEFYEEAKYGELRVSESGDLVLVGLHDANFNLLGPPK